MANDGDDEVGSTPDASLGSLDILSAIAASQGAVPATAANQPQTLVTEATLHALLFPRQTDPAGGSNAGPADDPQGDGQPGPEGASGAQDLLAALKMLHNGRQADEQVDGGATDWSPEERLAAVRVLDRKAEVALGANSGYAEQVRRMMTEVGAALERGDELETLAAFYAGAQGTEPSTVGTFLSNAGLVSVTLPFLKWRFGLEPAASEHAMIRERYNSIVQQQAWQSSERRRLADEVLKRARAIVAANKENSESATQEDLIDAFHSVDWADVAAQFEGRTPIGCRIQWMQRQHPSINRAKWTDRESEQLSSLASQHGERDWKLIAEKLGSGRTPAECVRQYRIIHVERREWSEEEDRLLREAVSVYGQNWQAVANQVGRTSNQCINRWSKSLKPNIKKGKWDASEDAALTAAVHSLGPVWKLVAPRVKGRTDAQCRERWVNILDPRIVIGNWEQEEDDKIIEMRNQNKSWSDISKTFNGKRTDNHVMRRHAELTNPKKKRKGKVGTGSRGAGDQGPFATEGALDVDEIDEKSPTAGSPSTPVPSPRSNARKRPAPSDEAPPSTRPKRGATSRLRREAYVEDDDEA